MSKGIEGGYYIKARKIQESWIMHQPPHVREIWEMFIRRASHSNYKSLSRGQLLITYDQIRDELHWMVGYRKMRYSKWNCESAMKQLRKATMITIKKTTRGMIVTVCNYDYYQNPKNYESHNCNSANTTREPQGTDTIDKNGKNDNKNGNKKSVHVKLNPPTLEEIAQYIKQKKYDLDPKKFYDFFHPDWIDSQGSKVRSWKQKIITWSGTRKKGASNAKTGRGSFAEQQTTVGQNYDE